ncbi:MAG: hypothetical protein WCC66_07325 [Rhizobiaceae bacterium]
MFFEELGVSEFQDRAGTRNNVTRLSDAIREVRIASADKADVVVDMKEADRARLELLGLELKPVFDEVPADNDLFDFAISSGLQPRLWIDAVSHVQMGRDRRIYRFVRDTRLGRVVVCESADMRPVAEQVTRYIAERLIERQRLMEGEPESLKSGTSLQRAVEQVSHQDDKSGESLSNIVAGLVWVLLGAVIGGGLLLAILSGQFNSLIGK